MYFMKILVTGGGSYLDVRLIMIFSEAWKKCIEAKNNPVGYER